MYLIKLLYFNVLLIFLIQNSYSQEPESIGLPFKLYDYNSYSKIDSSFWDDGSLRLLSYYDTINGKVYGGKRYDMYDHGKLHMIKGSYKYSPFAYFIVFDSLNNISKLSYGLDSVYGSEVLFYDNGNFKEQIIDTYNIKNNYKYLKKVLWFKNGYVKESGVLKVNVDTNQEVKVGLWSFFSVKGELIKKEHYKE